MRVHPTFIPDAHPLAAVNDVFNAIFVAGRRGGRADVLRAGRGGLPTGSAVVADMMEAARRLRRGGTAARRPPGGTLPMKPMEETVSRYYVSLRVVDRPGVLASHRRRLRATRRQHRLGHPEGPASKTRSTWCSSPTKCRRPTCGRALADIDELNVVRQISNVIRVEGGSMKGAYSERHGIIARYRRFLAAAPTKVPS